MSVILRPYANSDADALRAVFMSAVHAVASAVYTAEQCAAWAPLEYDRAAWAERLQHNKPAVAERDGVVAGFADLQDDGYIDQFFVAAAHAGQGVGRALMAHLLQDARQRGIADLYSNVSLRAEALFIHHGFRIEARQRVEVRGIFLDNARMRLLLT